MRRWPWFLVFFAASIVVGMISLWIKGERISLEDTIMVQAYLAQSVGAGIVVYIVPALILRKSRPLTTRALGLTVIVFFCISTLMLGGAWQNSARRNDDGRIAAALASLDPNHRPGDDKLAAIAASLRAQVEPHLPMKIDDYISLSRMETGRKSISFHFKIAAERFEDIDIAGLVTHGKQPGEKLVCDNSESSEFVRLGGTISLDFFISDNLSVATFNVDGCDAS